ncbi:hypothetical protein CMI37_32520 [Candidatus Pacearchaeota archaeon]|nr:hypothetical protein [Candidatus Pacearchaeota archaeon]|tara:strand:- start:22185 stop:22646 length:462 start_codon:yes stop_codon:yes gene_type:complete
MDEFKKQILEKKSKCPLCKNKLQKRNEGMVCKNSKCEMYFKCGQGWNLIHNIFKDESHISIEKMFSSNSRISFQQRWMNFKQEILRRDNYKCQHCEFNRNEDYYLTKQLEVHHIIYVTQNRSLQFDKENCITLCEDCHKIVHSKDKHKFGRIK